MRVIAKKTLKEFYNNPLYKDSKDSLEAWHNEALKANWNNPNDIKAQYKSASVVENNRVVFNIHSNKFRLIVKINYPAKIVFIRFVGTHEQYNNVKASEV